MLYAHLENLLKSPLSQGLNFMSQQCHTPTCFQSQKSYYFLRNCPNYSQHSVLIQRAMHLSCVWPVFQLSFSVRAANAPLLIYLQQFPLWLRISEAYGWCGGYCSALSSLPHTCSTWPLFPAADHHQITAPGAALENQGGVYATETCQCWFFYYSFLQEKYARNPIKGSAFGWLYLSSKEKDVFPVFIFEFSSTMNSSNTYFHC